MTNQPRSVSIAFTGSGGAGVITAGTMLLNAAAKAGLYGLFTRSSGPQIRGGEAAAMLRLADQPVAAPGDVFDILIALDWHNIDRFAVELPLSRGSLVFADPAHGDIPAVIAESGAQLIELPLKDMAKAIPQGRPNMIALGVAARLLNLPDETLDAVMARMLEKRGDAAVTASRNGVAAGAQAVKDISLAGEPLTFNPSPPERWMISGNEAAGLGAVRGGVRFVAAYPITPATEVLEWLAPNLQKVGGALVQAEDELASINMIIGASYGGTPALTATSGPGLALMTESIGLAVASEVPLVIIDVMRGGPSTGIPTKTEQSDLNIALFGLHGDAPHLVFAPNTIDDCLFTTQWAVTLAEATQTPAIVLSDQLLGQTKAVIDQPADIAFVGQRLTPSGANEHYKRYAVGDGGVSYMAIPGTQGGQYTADGLEHSETGLPSAQVSDHATQLDKRANKLLDYDFGDHWADQEGGGPLAVITWGSTTATVREALGRLKEKGREIRLIAPRLLSPLQPTAWEGALDGVERAIVVELNHTGQFYHYIKGRLNLPADTTPLHRPGPLPFRVDEMTDALEQWSTP